MYRQRQVYNENIYDAIMVLARALSVTMSLGQNTTSVSVVTNSCNMTVAGLVGNITTGGSPRVNLWFSLWLYQPPLASFTPVCEMESQHGVLQCIPLSWPPSFPVAGDTCIFERCYPRKSLTMPTSCLTLTLTQTNLP